MRQLAVPAMNDSAPDRTGRSSESRSRQLSSLASQIPEMHDSLVAPQHRKAAILVQSLEPEPVAVEVDRGSRLANRHRRDRLSHAHHRRNSL